MSFLPSLEQIRHQLLKETNPVEYQKQLSSHHESQKLAARANRILRKQKSRDIDPIRKSLLERYPIDTLHLYYKKKAKKVEHKKLSEKEWRVFCSIIAIHKLSSKRLRKKLRRFNKRKTKTPRRIEYETYINSALWTNRKNRFYQTHPRRCAACNTAKFIHLHHMVYSVQGQEPDEHLIPLCQDHHKEYHAKNGTQRDMLKRTIAFIEAIRENLRALNNAGVPCPSSQPSGAS